MWSPRKTTAMPNDQPTRRFRLRFSLRQLFLAVALVAVGLGTWNWVFRRVIEVRAPRAGEVSFDGNLGPLDNCLLKTPRNVAIVNGWFQKGMSLTVSLFVVKSGAVDERGADSVGFVSEGSIWES